MKIPVMKQDILKRAVLVVITLAAVASVVTGREKPALEVIEAKPPRAAASQAPEVNIDLDKLRRGEAAALQSDPFARRSFAPPQHAAAPDAPAAAPTAPPLPFRYIGKLTERGKTEILVMRGDEPISIAAGQQIDAEYRVDAITDSSIRFTYLPLRLKQSIDLAEVSG
jgi:hypothetical protein